MNREEIRQPESVDKAMEGHNVKNLVETLVEEDSQKKNLKDPTFVGLRKIDIGRVLKEEIKRGLEEGKSLGEIENYLRGRLELPKQ